MKARLHQKRFFFIAFIAGILVCFAHSFLSPSARAFAASEPPLSSAFSVSPSPSFAWIAKVFAAERDVVSPSLRAVPSCDDWCTKKNVSGWEKAEEAVKVYIPSGASVREIAILIDEALPHLNRKKFIKLARESEGFLFPDTYYFLPSVDEQSVFDAMRENFDDHTEKLKSRIKASGRTLEETVTMASIVEKEAPFGDAEAQREIAGVLWKRIEIDMPLQVDVTFQYINGKNSYQLTRADLAHTSAYNTYRYKGLPPSPITNPGFGALEAVLNPAATDNLYFLSDLEGNLYFSETFPEHLAKKEKYIP